MTCLARWSATGATFRSDSSAPTFSAARGAPSEWEDAKFSYAALARFPPESPIWGRVIREPASNKAYAEVKVSTIAGVVRYRALKRYRDAFRPLKQMAWGAALAMPLSESIALVKGDDTAD